MAMFEYCASIYLLMEPPTFNGVCLIGVGGNDIMFIVGDNEFINHFKYVLNWPLFKS